MAYNAFLKLEGITDANGTQLPLEVLHFNFGLTEAEDGISRGLGRTRFLGLSITRHVDVASPALLQSAENGRRFANGAIYTLPAVQSVGAVATPFLKFNFSDLFISTVQYTGNENGDVMPLEELTLNFLKIDLVVSSPNGT